MTMNTSNRVQQIENLLTYVRKAKNGNLQQQNQHQHQQPKQLQIKSINNINPLNAGREPGSDVMPSNISLEKRLQAIDIFAECVTNEDFAKLFANKKTRAIAYDGFEPSGRMHIAHGVLKAACVNRLTNIGVDFIFWVADWFALLNNKMNGDINQIRIVGEYMIEVWKAAGMNMEHVFFKWASDEINKHSHEYWMKVMDISMNSTITRTMRCCKIMGRKHQGDKMPTANLMYACMQCADIFFLKADICQLGMDQRKVNMLAREYANKKHMNPPIILSHPMLSGLKEGQEKMSSSDPDSAIFMEDSIADVNRKITDAFCTPLQIAGNPCLNWSKHLVFETLGEFQIPRKQTDGGDIVYNSYNELETDYINGSLHPGDLKHGLQLRNNQMLQPVRDHFANDQRAKQLLAQVQQFTVTK